MASSAPLHTVTLCSCLGRDQVSKEAIDLAIMDNLGIHALTEYDKFASVMPSLLGITRQMLAAHDSITKLVNHCLSPHCPLPQPPTSMYSWRGKAEMSSHGL